MKGLIQFVMSKIFLIIKAGTTFHATMREFGDFDFRTLTVPGIDDAL